MQLGWSPSKVSRIETGRTAINASDLRCLLDFYQVSGSYRDRLTELGRTAAHRGWWDAYADTLRYGYSTLIALESDAESERHFAPVLVPGLLQTERYAQEVTRSSLLIAPPGEVVRRVQVRMARQQVLNRDSPLDFSAVLDEGALRRQIGDSKVMKDQLSHLAMMARQPNITLQVLPFARGPHPAMFGVFTILRFPGVVESGVVFLENMTNDLFIESEAEVYRYGLAFDRLCELALGEEESITMINDLSNEIR